MTEKQNASQPQAQASEHTHESIIVGAPPSFWKRALTSFFYVVVYVAAIYFGKVPLTALMAVVACICALEFYDIMRKEGKIANVPVGVAGATLFPVGAALWGIPGVALVMVFTAAATLAWYAFSVRIRFIDVAVTIAGAMYSGMFLGCYVLLRDAAPGLSGALLAFAVLASVWANDSFAYIFGSMFGRHKMVPKISPKKSWEGFFAGVVGSVIFWCLIPLIPGVHVAWGWAIVGGVAGGVFGVIGDIVESRLKREAGVKDSGTILPGHGGMLDRSDSMMLAGLVAVVVLRFAGVIG